MATKTVASDNPYPSILVAEQGSAPTTPASGYGRIYCKSDGLYFVGDNGTEIGPLGASGAGGLYDAYVCVQDQKAQNTQGGSSTGTTWHTRVLNTEVADTASIASIASNQLTLAAGTYHVEASAPAFRAGGHQVRLQNITGTATLLWGSVEWNSTSGDVAQTRSFVRGRFTLAVESVLELQHYIGASEANNGLGVACNVGTEVYAVAEFWRES